MIYKLNSLLTCVCRYSQNILMLRHQMNSTQKQVASLGKEPQKTDPLREEQIRELQAQLETLRSKMHQMEALEKTFSKTQRQLEVRLCHQMVQNTLSDLMSSCLMWLQFVDTENSARRGDDEKNTPSCLTRGVCHTILISCSSASTRSHSSYDVNNVCVDSTSFDIYNV